MKFDLDLNINDILTAKNSQVVMASVINLSLTNTYGYVLLVGVLICFEITLFGFIIPGRVRNKYFSKQFMDQNFGESHKDAFNTQIEKGGYPDMGGGIYSQKLNYKDWVEFNNAQRAHKNYIEFAPTILVCLFVAGIYFPIPASVMGLVIIIARIMYAIGYTQPSYIIRQLGVLGNHLSILGLFGLAVTSSIMFILGRKP